MVAAAWATAANRATKIPGAGAQVAAAARGTWGTAANRATAVPRAGARVAAARGERRVEKGKFYFVHMIFFIELQH